MVVREYAKYCIDCIALQNPELSVFPWSGIFDMSLRHIAIWYCSKNTSIYRKKTQLWEAHWLAKGPKQLLAKLGRGLLFLPSLSSPAFRLLLKSPRGAIYFDITSWLERQNVGDGSSFKMPFAPPPDPLSSISLQGNITLEKRCIKCVRSLKSVCFCHHPSWRVDKVLYGVTMPFNDILLCPTVPYMMK